MKPLFLLPMLIAACGSNKKTKIQVPIDATVSVSADTSVFFNIQKSPEEKQFRFKVDASGGDSVRIENQSK